MEDALIKPDIVLVTKNVMVPLALPAPQNKLFPAPGSSRRKTTIVRGRKTRVSPKRAVRSGENTVLQTNVKLLRSSDYLACDYDSLVNWEQDVKKDYELLYSDGFILGDAGFGDSCTEENKRSDYLSQNFLKHCETFSSINDKKCWNLDKSEGKDMLFENSGQSKIHLGEKKKGHENINLGGKEHTLGDSLFGAPGENKNQNCLSRRFPICSMAATKDSKKFETLLSVQKDNGKEKADCEKSNFEKSMKNHLNLFDTDVRWKPRESGSITELRRCASSEMSSDENGKQNCLSQSFPTHSTAAMVGMKIEKPSSISPDTKVNCTEKADRKEITFERSTKNELKMLEANVRWNLKENRSIVDLRRCTSSEMSSEHSKSFDNERNRVLNECEIKYSWQDLENWVPPSAKKKIAEIDEKSDLSRAKKTDCKITYSWQIIGTGAQTSYELIRSLLTSAVEPEAKRDVEATNYPCSVKYSWQIIGTGTQVSFSRVNKDSLPIDEDYWNGKILKPRRLHLEGWKKESEQKAGKLKIVYNEMTQTVTDESHQTELGDCRVKYSWQNLTKPYLEKNRRP